MKIEASTKEGKRYKATFESNGRTVHFGSKNGSTYIDHKDKAKRAAYLSRHKVNEDWTDPYSPGALSRFLLWGDSTTLAANHAAYMKKFPNV
tara:strand:- start:1258 stop:1533 length:276 start_codon:yes stop_codon:yes gene_type:complete